MGYEPLVPPIPNRKEEINYINELKRNFQDQPHYKYYSPEHVRINKMELGDRVTRYNKDWMQNFVIGKLESDKEWVSLVSWLCLYAHFSTEDSNQACHFGTDQSISPRR